MKSKILAFLAGALFSGLVMMTSLYGAESIEPFLRMYMIWLVTMALAIVAGIGIGFSSKIVIKVIKE